MANLRTSLTLDLSGNLITRAKAFSTSISGMARRIRSSLGGLNGVAAQAGKGLEALTGKYAAGIAGLGVTYKATQAVMNSAQLDKSLVRVGQTAGASVQDVAQLRRSLFDMARQTGQPVETLLQGFEGLVASGMDWQQAMGTIQAINPALAASGASAEQLASAMSVAGEIFKFDLSDLNTSKLLLDQMLVAGRAGNAELENLSSIFARVGGSAKNAGLDFAQTLAFIEQLSLIEREPERLATLADSTLRLFTNQKYLEKGAEATGVRFYDAKGERRAAFDVLQDIARRYQQFKTDAERDKAFAQAFGETDLDTQRGLRALFDKGALLNMGKTHKEIAQAGGAVEKALGDAINNSVDQVARLKAALGQAADEFSRPINDAISKGINLLLDNGQLSGKQMLAGAATAGVLGFGGLKLAGMGLSRMGAKAAGGLVATVAKQVGLAGLKLPLPVYVVNKQMSLTREAMLGEAPMPQGGKGKTAAAGKKPAQSLLARGGRYAARGAGLAAAGLAVYDAGRVLTGDQASIGQKAGAVADAAGGALGGWGGAALGAKVGASIGTVIAPGLGTAIGTALGGVVGGIAGSELGQGLAALVKDWFGSDAGNAAQAAAAESIRQSALTMQAASQYISSAMAGGVAVDVRVQGNAQATLRRGQGSVYSGTSFAQGIGAEG